LCAGREASFVKTSREAMTLSRVCWACAGLRIGIGVRDFRLAEGRGFSKRQSAQLAFVILGVKRGAQQVAQSAALVALKS